jgi:hypothetical protein
MVYWVLPRFANEMSECSQILPDMDLTKSIGVIFAIRVRQSNTRVKQGMNLQQHKQHDSTIIPLATTQLAAGIVLRQLLSILMSIIDNYFF